MNKTGNRHQALQVTKPIIRRPRRQSELTDAIPPEASLITLSEFFKVFGDVTRIKILHLLSGSDLFVHDIASLLGMNQSAISHQLRILKQARLVKYRRNGRSICYSIDDEHVKQIFSQGLEHINE